MSRKPKNRRNSRDKSKYRQELWTPITRNPFLNFFLTKCGVRGNSKLHKFARAVSNEWTNMNYHEKSPYYQLADKARRKRLKLMRKSGEIQEKIREELKSKIETEKNNENEAISSKKSSSVTYPIENIANDEIRREHRSSDVLENWLSVTEFATQPVDIENALLAKKSPPGSIKGSTHLSMAVSFHSTMNNCCSDDLR